METRRSSGEGKGCVKATMASAREAHVHLKCRVDTLVRLWGGPGHHRCSGGPVPLHWAPVSLGVWGGHSKRVVCASAGRPAPCVQGAVCGVSHGRAELGAALHPAHLLVKMGGWEALPSTLHRVAMPAPFSQSLPAGNCHPHFTATIGTYPNPCHIQ